MPVLGLTEHQIHQAGIRLGYGGVSQVRIPAMRPAWLREDQVVLRLIGSPLAYAGFDLDCGQSCKYVCWRSFWEYASTTQR